MREYIQLNVDVIVTSGAGAFVAKQATSVIPIVFTVEIDPLASGLVSSLGRPGANVTGNSLQAADAAGKRIATLREIIPRLRRLAILGNISYPSTLSEMAQAEMAANKLGIDVVKQGIRRADDIPHAFDAFQRDADALYVAVEPLAISQRFQINSLALKARLPTVSGTRDFAAADGFMAYGPNFPTLFRRSADMVDKILRGTKVGEIPVEQPTKFDLVINLKTAKALGIAIPTSLISLVDEFIE